MPADRDAALDRIDNALSGVDLAAPSTTKYSKLETALAALAGLQAHEVVAATISKAGNFSVRASQSKRAQAAKLFVGVLTDRQELESTRRAAVGHIQDGKAPAVLLLVRTSQDRWSAPWGVESRSGRTPLRLLADVLQSQVTHVQPPADLTDTPAAATDDPPPVPVVSNVPMQPLVLDPRVRRMLRTAVASRPAVMLVGPPGTGKSQLVNELLADIAKDPAIVGMSQAHDALTVTPDESWTTRELVGGETVDDAGHIRFTPGVVLQAIGQDRWLVLDEANRGDLDRIFGGLLTWLAGNHVDIGRVSSAPDAQPIRLGWTTSPQSTAIGTAALMAEPKPSGDGGNTGDDSVEYLAGSEWRLLGTYNALDAQRVFRFGLALGRRFAHVPVPPLDQEGFALALEPRLATVSDQHRDETRTRLLGIYQAHLDIEAAALGPAIFLDIPGYVAAAPADADVEELLAEAYLTSTGTWLARLDDTQLDQLGVVLANASCLSDQWAWVRAQLPALR